jgi:hypothetical protein
MIHLVALGKSGRATLEAIIRGRWFVGLNADDDVWDATVFTKNRDRFLEADAAKEFPACVVAQARAKGLCDEHLSVDGTLLEAMLLSVCKLHRSQD